MSKVQSLQRLRRQRRCCAAALSALLITPLTTARVDLQPRMGDPLDGLTPNQLERFELGKIAFNRPLQEEEGLGPVFNQSSCASCHNNPIGGSGTQLVTRFGTDDKKGGFNPLDNLGGSLLQAQTINKACQEFVPIEATIVTNRATPSALGFGLVEAIPDADIEANELTPPSVNVSGFVHWVLPLEDDMLDPLRAGRMGWKAQVATVLTFSGDAGLNEMGLTNRLVLTENDPNGDLPPDISECDFVADPEDNTTLGDGEELIDRFTDFQRFLAAPPQTPKSGMTGEALFAQVGCTDCHVACFFTPDDVNLEDALRDKKLQPYSDFLLHDMGLAGDFIVQGDAGSREVRTTPLWGIRVRNPLWHDARFIDGTIEQRILDSINEHDVLLSEAAAAGQAFSGLSGADQNRIVDFLLSLGQAEFDADGDNDVDLDDFGPFHACFDGGAITPDDDCAVHDIDQDGDADFDDFNDFLAGYVGPRRDCDDNGVLDLIDILNDTLADNDNNGFADLCEPTCNIDANGNGEVDVFDLLEALDGFGACPGGLLPCAGDVNFDGVVDVFDLLEILGGWGPC